MHFCCRTTKKAPKLRCHHQLTRGRCYDHNFLRFLPMFGEKIGVFFIKDDWSDFCKN
jgi:hypothetical protein